MRSTQDCMIMTSQGFRPPGVSHQFYPIRVQRNYLALSSTYLHIQYQSISQIKTSTNVIGHLARTEFFNHFSIFLNQQIHLNKINSIEINNALKFLNEFTWIPQ